jgi:hypothetical protein
MAYRTFVDRDGAYWQVWDSQPSRAERRQTQVDRRVARLYPWRGAERRTGPDRRIESQRRITMSQGYGSGWLTFESLSEKRRLMPIPPHWDEMTQGDLRQLCERAKAVTRLDTNSNVA